MVGVAVAIGAGRLVSMRPAEPFRLHATVAALHFTQTRASCPLFTHHIALFNPPKADNYLKHTMKSCTVAPAEASLLCALVAAVD